MNSATALSLPALLLASCAIQPATPGSFAFGVMGDAPYNAREERRFDAMVERMGEEPLAFVVHVGDIKGPGGCTDALLARRKAEFDASRHPLVYTPGDNEWVDCRVARGGSRDPLERLARIREVFFADRWSLGARRIETAVQSECVERRGEACACPIYVENRRWSHERVVFATLNVPGSDNNVGFDAEGDAEARCRNEANRRWLEAAISESAATGVLALVVLIQANPWETRKPVYKPLLAQLEAAAAKLRKPLLFVHGDTHTYRVDTPFVDRLGEPIANLVRLETFGSPIVGWVKVVVDPAAPDVFRFEPHLYAVVPPR